MKAEDILKKVNSNDAQESMLDRDSSLSGGMELGNIDEDDDLSDFFSDDDFGDTGSTDFSQSGGLGGLNSGLNSGLGGGLGGGLGNPFGMPQNNMMQPQNQQAQKRDAEDIAFEVLGKSMKGMGAYFKELGMSFKGLKARFWTKYGATVIIVGAGFEIFGIISLILIPKIAMNFIVSGILNLITGVACLTFMYDKARSECGVVEELNDVNIVNENDEIDLDGDDEEDNDFSDFSLDDEDEDLFGDDEEDGIFGESDSSDDEFADFDMFGDLGSTSTDVVSTEPKVIDYEAVSESLDKIEEGTLYTRSYIYEKLKEILPTVTPEYDVMKEIDESSDVFSSYNHIIKVCSSQLTNKEEEIPYLIKASENGMYIMLVVSRTKALKSESNVNSLCTEIANFLKVDEDTGSVPEENEGIYAVGTLVADKVYIKVYKGEGLMVSVGDIIQKEPNFFLDASNKMPVAIGIDQDGKPVIKDFKDIESILITGVPRGGKTWATLAIVAQLVMWCPPSEVELIFCDPKNNISDFKNFNLPHVKKFITKDSDIISTLKKLTTEEKTRRENIMGKVEDVKDREVNIWDYKKAHPDVHLPIVYVIIDEVISINDRMDKETKEAFQGYLRVLVTQMPAVGVRVILLPHEVKNDIINKTTTNSIPCRFSVRGDEAHVKHNVLADAPTKFSYQLRNKGDMAMKLVGLDAKYVKSAVLSNDNKINVQIFEYLRKLWTKLEPESVLDSVAKELMDREELNKIRDEIIEKVDKVDESEDIAEEIDNLDNSFMDEDEAFQSLNDEIEDFFNMGDD